MQFINQAFLVWRWMEGEGGRGDSPDSLPDEPAAAYFGKAGSKEQRQRQQHLASYPPHLAAAGSFISNSIRQRCRARAGVFQRC